MDTRVVRSRGTWVALVVGGLLAAAACGADPSAGRLEASLTAPVRPSESTADVDGSSTGTTMSATPGLPQFDGDQDPFCRSLAIDTWTPGMAITRAETIGDPATGCAVHYDFFDGSPGYVVAERRATDPGTAWVFAPTEEPDEHRSVLESGTTVWIDPDGPDNASTPGTAQAILLRPDGRLYAVFAHGAGAEEFEGLVRQIDWAAAHSGTRGEIDTSSVDARPLAVAFNHSPIWMEPPSPTMLPHLAPADVARAADLLFRWLDDPAVRLIARFGSYHRTDAASGKPTGETVPAWLLIFDGITLIPSCAATTSHPPATSGCKPIPGHALDVIADSDGTLIYREHQTGGPVPAT